MFHWSACSSERQELPVAGIRRTPVDLFRQALITPSAAVARSVACAPAVRTPRPTTTAPSRRQARFRCLLIAPPVSQPTFAAPGVGVVEKAQSEAASFVSRPSGLRISDPSAVLESATAAGSAVPSTRS
jgi:hypothetical protein